jgi:hypothetical protein
MINQEILSPLDTAPADTIFLPRLPVIFNDQPERDPDQPRTADEQQQQQQKRIYRYHGTIFDIQTGERIPFATVKLLPSGETTTAGADGYFKFAVSEPNDKVVFSSVNYGTQIQAIDEMRDIFQLKKSDKITNLQGVTVKAKKKKQAPKKQDNKLFLFAGLGLLAFLMMKK